MPAEFEWDSQKQRTNLVKHGIDFIDAIRIWGGPIVEKPAPRDFGEARIIACGMLDGRVITVIYTWRGEVRRLISARRARKHEETDYHEGLARERGAWENRLGSGGRPH